MMDQSLHPESAVVIPFIDCFQDDRSAGKVIGSTSPEGVVRQGIDVEGVMSIDRGALRIQPLLQEGWGRAGIVYGPYHRQNGLAFAVFLLNGHNTSETGAIERYDRRLRRWLRGSDVDSRRVRLARWIRSPRKKGVFRRFRWWMRSAFRGEHTPNIQDNLAVGWFTCEIPSNPSEDGNAFVVHALGAENGELQARVGAERLPAIHGLQNLQTYYIVILREQGAAYYAASVPHAHGLVAYPQMRPLAIDPFQASGTVYAGLHPSVMGQIGFRVDTRVYGASVQLLPEQAAWYGTAHTADSLRGEGSLDLSSPEVGKCWHVLEGEYTRSGQGVIASEPANIAVTDPAIPSGLVHLLVTTQSGQDVETGILWRVLDDQNYWCFTASRQGSRLRIKQNGLWTTVREASDWRLITEQPESIQVVDSGEDFSVFLNGAQVFGTEFRDSRFTSFTGIGIMASGQCDHLVCRSFEAHPQVLEIPSALQMGAPWRRQGEKAVIADDFDGPPQKLDGRIAPLGGGKWQRVVGKGEFKITGDCSARVVASIQTPNPGRTIYTLPWQDPAFADIQVEITAPGSERWQGEKGRGGLVFWQDERNYITINNWIDDFYDGSSISSFFYLDGVEEIYDAVWTNVGTRIGRGKTYTLRAVFDGLHYTAYINDEPVLYRALTDVYPDFTPLSIHRVGIAANWEWGNDTGSIFRQFTGRR